MTTDEIRALVARLDEGFTRRDAAALAANYAEDCIVESPIAGVHVGREAVERVFRRLFVAFPNFHRNTEELLIFGDRGVERLTASGVDNGGFMGLPPTGRPFSVSAIFLYTFKGSQIAHERRVYDFSRLLLQLAGEAGPATEGPLF